jgi:cation diffusion facilitator family transporter
MTGTGDRRKERTAQLLAVASIATSVLLAAALLAVLVAFESEIVAAQLADSFVDVVTGLALLFAIRISVRPPDADHPFGHERAEPIAALVVAVIAGAVAIEVVTGAADAFFAGARPIFAAPVLGVLLAKGALKAAISIVARRLRRGALRPSLHAIEVDARNDALVSTLAIAGALVSSAGLYFVDAILAGLTGLWIAWSGFSLARENVRLLMGESVPDSDLEEFRRIAASTEGLRGVGAVEARFHGTRVEVAITVVVDEELSVRSAHDIGAAVRKRLEEIDTVAWATVHLDAPSTTDGLGSRGLSSLPPEREG